MQGTKSREEGGIVGFLGVEIGGGCGSGVRVIGALGGESDVSAGIVVGGGVVGIESRIFFFSMSLGGGRKGG